MFDLVMHVLSWESSFGATSLRWCLMRSHRYTDVGKWAFQCINLTVAAYRVYQGIKALMTKKEERSYHDYQTSIYQNVFAA